MTINPTGAKVHEHIYARERTGGRIYCKVDPSTKKETDDERVIAVNGVRPRQQALWPLSRRDWEACSPAGGGRSRRSLCVGIFRG